MSEMNILFIAMEFIPLNLGGVFRPLRFVNGLKQNKINPIIITFDDNANLRKVQTKFDYDLLEKLNKDIRVYRIPLDDIGKYYKSRLARFRNIYFNVVSDNYRKAWEENLFQQLPAIIKEHQPRAVFVTCPPFSGAQLGVRISREFKLPLILDMRDAWAKMSMSPLGSYFHYLYKQRIERTAFRQARTIITVTPQLKKIFQETHPEIPAEKFKLIYNGFDFDLPAALSVRSGRISEQPIFNIGYIGAFYYSPSGRDQMFRKWWQRKGHRMLQYTPVKEDWLYRSPYFFFRTMALLFEKHPEWRSKLFFHYIGETPDWLMEMAEETKVENNVVLHGFQTLARTLELQQSFDLLLATSEKVIGNDHYCLPSKLFTYLRSGKPLLGFVTRGVQHDFIEKSRLGVICDPDDLIAASGMIEEMISKGYTAGLDLSFLSQFANPVAIKDLTALIAEVAGQEADKR